MRSGVGEEDRRSKHTDAPAVILPAPAAQSAAGTIFEVYHGARSCADSESGGARVIGAVGELHKDRVIERIVALRFASNPQTICRTRHRVESHFKIGGRVRECVSQFWSADVGIEHSHTAGGG